ncbi:MAG TPA: FlgD immunoglobulin-like domain containing protein [Candidatus Omnitrophota bacterium]|nr:FlgD immunoglobulin-like domain containing protein [Candidatus Omnitrophota bacterium]
MRPLRSRIVFLALVLAAAIPATAHAARTAQAGAEPPPAGVARNQASSLELLPPGMKAGRIQRAPATGETLYVFRDSLETRSSPSNEGGWTHYDQSLKPTAWHVDSLLSCQGAAWWCGLVDSTWIYDTNRAGYDNDWTQYLSNIVDLSGIPAGTPVTLGFRHRFNAEPLYDFGFVQVFDPDDADWNNLATFTGAVPNNQNNCDTVTVVIPDSTRLKYNPVSFRFKFTSDVGYSSADGLYNGDGWIIDNITIKAGTDIRLFDDGHGNAGHWSVTTNPGVGDLFWLSGNLFTEDVCSSNTSKVWTAWDPVVQSLVPRMDDVLNTPPVAINRASDAFVEFDVYRNLPLQACFYYHLNFRTKNVGGNWSAWQDPTFFVYYGGNKDWARQRIPLPGAGEHDSLQVQLGLRDYSATFCDGISSPNGVYAFFDNVAIGVIGTAPPSFVVRDLDLFNDTFSTTPFYKDDNFNSAVGDTTVVNVNTSLGYKNGFMFYRTAPSGAFSSTPLVNVAPAIPTRFYADVPAASYAAGTTLQYYFAATDSMNNTATYPTDAVSAQHYLTASILPLKTATNPGNGCFDSLATILFVNHFSGRETSPRIADALKALGYKFDTWDVNGPSSGVGNCLGGSDPNDIQYHWPPTNVASLTQYKTIIWHSGDLSSFTITPQDQAVLQSWIQQSGRDRNLWITGDDVGYELTASGADYNSFMGFTAGARYLRDSWENQPADTLHPVVSGVAGGPAAGRFFHLNGDCPIINKFDLITPSNQAQSGGKWGVLLRYPNTQPAATRYATKYVSFGTDSARAVFMGFSFNSIEEGGERLQLAKAITQNYFLENPCYSPTAVLEDPAGQAPPARTQLFQNAPNPFNPATTIRFSVGQRGPVRIDIFDVGGRHVRTLVEKSYEPGVYTARWDGVDDAGRPLASGAYFYRMTAPGASDAKKLILLR